MNYEMVNSVDSSVKDKVDFEYLSSWVSADQTIWNEDPTPLVLMVCDADSSPNMEIFGYFIL
jgi:hypothetical protein